MIGKINALEAGLAVEDARAGVEDRRREGGGGCGRGRKADDLADVPHGAAKDGSTALFQIMSHLLHLVLLLLFESTGVLGVAPLASEDR